MAKVWRVMEALELVLPEPRSPLGYEYRRFSSDGMVVVQETIACVYIGGTLIGVYDEQDDDRGPRNVLVVTLAKSGELNFERLAAAFGIGDEYLRRLRRKEEVGGLGAVLGKRRGKNNSKVTLDVRAKWFAMFDAGRMPVDAHREQPRTDRRAYSTVWAVWEQWRSERQASQRPPANVPTPVLVTPDESTTNNQLPLWSAATQPESEPEPEPEPETDVEP